MSNFGNGTKQIAYGLVEATNRNTITIIGGGDTVAAINQ